MVSSEGGIERPVMREDGKGNHFKLMKDLNKDVEDFIIQDFANADSEMGKCGFTGERSGNTGIGSIGSPAVFIVQYREKQA